MFKLFKKKEPALSVHSPVSGRVIPLSEAKDEVFSQQMMGDGFAVVPANDKLVAPVSAKVVSVFPTKHAMELDANGIGVLLHFGVDTVDLKGAPFSINVSAGDEITQGQALGTMDLAMLADKGADPTTFVVFPELAADQKLEHQMSNAVITPEDVIITIQN